MAAKRRAASAASSFSIMCIMLILAIMFIALCNKLEDAHTGNGQEKKVGLAGAVDQLMGDLSERRGRPREGGEGLQGGGEQRLDEVLGLR